MSAVYHQLVNIFVFYNRVHKHILVHLESRKIEMKKKITSKAEKNAGKHCHLNNIVKVNRHVYGQLMAPLGEKFFSSFFSYIYTVNMSRQSSFASSSKYIFSRKCDYFIT